MDLFNLKANVFVARGDLKNATLNAINRGLNKSKDIFNSMDYPSYQNFHKNLYNLVRRGYIHKSGIRPKSRYSLTKKGKFHLKNPNYYQERKEIIFSKKVEAIMRDSPEYQRVLMNLASEDIKNQNNYSAPPVFVPFNDKNSDAGFGGSINKINKIDKTDKLVIEKLKNEVSRLKNEKAEISNQKNLLIKHIKSGDGRVKSEHNLKLANNRKKLTAHYMKKYNGELDLKFFTKWNIHPCLLKGATIYNKGSIDIISKSNAEFQRGHVKRELNDGEIITAQLRISKYDKNGIWVNGQGLNKPKLLKFDRYSRTTKTPKPTKQAETAPQPQIKIKASSLTN